MKAASKAPKASGTLREKSDTPTTAPAHEKHVAAPSNASGTSRDRADSPTTGSVCRARTLAPRSSSSRSWPHDSKRRDDSLAHSAWLSHCCSGKRVGPRCGGAGHFVQYRGYVRVATPTDAGEDEEDHEGVEHGHDGQGQRREDLGRKWH